MTPSTTRRAASAIAAAAALSAAVPVLAGSVPPLGPDPIFAVIEAHRTLLLAKEAHEAFEERWRQPDGRWDIKKMEADSEWQAWDARQDEMSRETHCSALALTQTVATTVPGLRALVRYLGSESRRGNFLENEGELEQMFDAFDRSFTRILA